VLEHAKIPMIFLNALDDPLVLQSLIPYDLVLKNDNIILLTTQHGGHLGWMDGFLLPKIQHWLYGASECSL
jgi:predicted alpha/beta-fold hydrolase